MGRVTKILIVMLVANISIGIIIFSNKPTTPPSIGYETLIENIENVEASQDDEQDEKKKPTNDTKLVGL